MAVRRESNRRRELIRLREEAAACRRCDLWRHATQTVFGEGRANADLMLVGEQPGDVEDIEGKPFVGPAGRLLMEALERAGIDPARCYLTNAVKHFKWEPRGRLVVALGATAARTLVGPGARVIKQRGQWLSSPFGAPVLVTVHPSSVLRAPDREAREAARAALVQDLRLIVRRLNREG